MDGHSCKSSFCLYRKRCSCDRVPCEFLLLFRRGSFSPCVCLCILDAGIGGIGGIGGSSGSSIGSRLTDGLALFFTAFRDFLLRSILRPRSHSLCRLLYSEGKLRLRGVFCPRSRPFRRVLYSEGKLCLRGIFCPRSHSFRRVFYS